MFQKIKKLVFAKIKMFYLWSQGNDSCDIDNQTKKIKPKPKTNKAISTKPKDNLNKSHRGKRWQKIPSEINA